MKTSTTTPGLGELGRARSSDGTQPISTVRVLYPDLHGAARGKDVPAGQFEAVAHSGLSFCAAVMGTDLRHTPVLGGEEGYPDLIARPEVATMRALPWEPGVACCLAELSPADPARPVADPRGALRGAVRRLGELGYEPVVGPELEFFLLRADPADAAAPQRHMDRLSMVYTVGPQSDPGAVVRRMTESLAEAGLPVFAVNHEFFNSQYEINLRHRGALGAADDAFLLKAAVKDMAAQHGLMATFMGKPFNDQGGSGMHLHVSLARAGENAFAGADPALQRGVSDVLGHFAAGVLAHADALMALLCPTINAYRRLQPDSLAPTHANWGFDNRATCIRVPPERGAATRLELRAGDGAANPYLAIAGVLLAGADGLVRGLDPPMPLQGDAYRAAAQQIGRPLPRTLEAALAALEADELLCGGLGAEIVQTFLAIKRYEIERHRAWVSDWEIAEYAQHL